MTLALVLVAVILSIIELVRSRFTSLIAWAVFVLALSLSGLL